MTPIITPAHVTSELFLIGFVATFLTAATVWVLWYVHETNFPDDIKDPGFFLTFIIVVVPFVMLIYFGLAVLNYDAIVAWSGSPQVLPVKNSLSPLILGTVVFYVGQTVWLWLDWRRN